MIQYWKYDNENFPVVENSYGTRKTVRNKNGNLSDNNTKLGPIKKKTEKENEILPAVDDSSPGAEKQQNRQIILEWYNTEDMKTKIFQW